MRALKMGSVVASHQKLAMTSWEPSSKLILFQLQEKLLKNSISTIVWSVGIWSKLGKWKSSISGCLMSWLKIKKNCHLKCCLLLVYAATTNHFSIGLWQAVKSEFYTTTSDNHSVVRPQRSSKTLFRAKLAPKKRSWSLLGGLLPIWPTTIFWIPAKLLHPRICSANW